MSAHTSRSPVGASTVGARSFAMWPASLCPHTSSWTSIDIDALSRAPSLIASLPLSLSLHWLPLSCCSHRRRHVWHACAQAIAKKWPEKWSNVNIPLLRLDPWNWGQPFQMA
eukprot:4142209-Prymnesium_polylepis.1